MLHRVVRRLRFMRKSKKPRPCILMYHRVASIENDPWDLAVPPELFACQMAYLKSYRQPLAMSEFVRRLQNGTLPAEAAAITFDDGYRDNLVNALPILDEMNLPATVFLATDFIDSNEPLWWDELAAMTLPSTHPATVTQPCGNDVVELRWGRLEPRDRRRWRAGEGAMTERQRSFFEAWKTLRAATEAERSSTMAALRSVLTVPADPLSYPMSSADIRLLLEHQVISLGAHSATHPPLSTVGPAERQREIRQSARVCAGLAGRSADGFAYPYGDVDAATREDVAAAGFMWACSTRNAFVDESSFDVFLLPRLAVRKAPLREFVDMTKG